MIHLATKQEKEKPLYNIFKNKLVPQAKILSEEETTKILEKYNITKIQLPRILLTDALTKEIEAKAGDVIEFERKTRTAGLSKYYRIVVGGGK